VIRWDSVFQLGIPKPVVSIYEYRKHRFERFDFTAKATTPARKHRDIVPYVGVYALNCKGVVLVVDITHMPSGVNDIQNSPHSHQYNNFVLPLMNQRYPVSD
jgi:hypothetical protein